MDWLFKKIEEYDFDIPKDYQNDSILVSQNFNGYELEFIVDVDKVLKNHIEASYLQPEEGDIDFFVKEIPHIALYGWRGMEEPLSERELDNLRGILENRYLNTKL